MARYSLITVCGHKNPISLPDRFDVYPLITALLSQGVFYGGGMTHGCIADCPEWMRIDNQKLKSSSKNNFAHKKNSASFYYLLNEVTGEVWRVTLYEASDITGFEQESLRKGNFKKGKKIFGNFSLFSESMARDRKIFNKFFVEEK